MTAESGWALAVWFGCPGKGEKTAEIGIYEWLFRLLYHAGPILARKGTGEGMLLRPKTYIYFCKQKW